MTKLHRLTPEGIARFTEFVDSQGTTEAEAYDADMLTSPVFAETAGTAPDIPATCDFATRFDAAQAVATIIDTAEIRDAEFDRGVWTWLSWLWFESLCPTRRNGQRDPKNMNRWVLNLSYDRYYRHLLAGPWWIYQAHRGDPDVARALLCTAVDKPGEVVEQIASRQELVSNPGLVEMVTRLYYDSEKARLKRGSATKGAGSVRRLAKVVRQLDLLWDLYSTSASEFMDLLPSEFDRFKTT